MTKRSIFLKCIFIMTILIILLFNINILLCANTLESSSQDDTLKFQIDAVNLASEKLELSRLDLYIKIKYDELQFLKAEKDGFRAEYEMSVVITDKSGKRVAGKVWNEEVVTSNLDDINSMRLSKLSKTSFNLLPGDYDISFDLKDLETLHSGHKERTISLRNYSDHEVLSSDILYLDYLSENEDGNVTFSPKVSSVRYENSILYGYFEVYNIPTLDSILVEYTVEDNKNKIIRTGEFWRKSDGQITKIFVEIAGSGLPHGKYSTLIKLSNQKSTINIKRPFDWFWAGLPKTIANLDEAIDVLKYLASNKELKRIKKYDNERKYAALINFWKKRDPTPDTNVNELQDEYYQRIKYANENFFGINKKGWKTDMGWVYVKLGLPDAIERRPYSLRSSNSTLRTIKASEIWAYYKYNRQLIFLDENGFGEYRLANPSTFYDIFR